MCVRDLVTCMRTRPFSSFCLEFLPVVARPAVSCLRRLSPTRFLSLMGFVSPSPCKLSRLAATMAETASRLPVCLVLIFLLIAPHQPLPNSPSLPTQSVVLLRLVLALSATPFLFFFLLLLLRISTLHPSLYRSHFVSESLVLDCAASPWDVSTISRSLISQWGSWQGSAAR